MTEPSRRTISVAIPTAAVLPALVILLTMTNGLYNSLEVAFGKGPPFDTFVFSANDLFGDLAKSALSYPGPVIRSLATWPAFYRSYFENNPYGGAAALTEGKLSNLHGMPLPTLILLSVRYAFAFWTPRFVVGAFLFLAVAPFMAFVWSFTHRSNARWIIVAAYLLSYPLIFAITRGNITAIMLGEALVVASVLTWRGQHIGMVALLLALTLNLRPNAVILLALPLLCWNFRQSVAAAAAAVALAIAMFLAALTVTHFLYADYTFTNFLNAVLVYRKNYAVGGDDGLSFGSSLLGGIKLLVYILRGAPSAGKLEVICLLLGIASIGLWLLLVGRGRLHRVDGLFILIAIYALFSGVFGDYHLIVFFCFVLIFAQEDRNPSMLGKNGNFFVWAAALLMLSPKNYVFWHGLSVQIILNPLVLLIAVLGISAQAILAQGHPDRRCAC